MTLTDQIYAQALTMAGKLEPEEDALLRVLSRSANNTLAVRLRPGITPEDCKADFIATASLYALAALSEAAPNARVESFTAGDITVRREGGSAAANCLRYQANLILMPYLKDGFSFQGV